MASTSQPALLMDLTQPSYEFLLHVLQGQLQQGRAPLANMPYMQHATSAVHTGAQLPASTACSDWGQRHADMQAMLQRPQLPTISATALIARGRDITAPLPTVQAPRTNTAPNVQNAQVQRVNAAPPAAVQPVDKATNVKKRKAPAQQESAFPLVDKWLCGSQYLEIKGKTLKAYDCGGEIFRVQRGRGVEDLMAKFEAFLAAHPDGNYFN